MRQNLKKDGIFCGPATSQGGQNLPGHPRDLENCGKMTGMDLLEFRDINGPDPMPKYGAIWSIGCLVWISPPPGIFRVKVKKMMKAKS